MKVGVDSEEGPPVPIPNTVVKLFCAEDTWRAAARENKAMPTQTKQPLNRAVVLFLYIATQKTESSAELSVSALFKDTCKNAVDHIEEINGNLSEYVKNGVSHRGCDCFFGIS